MFWKIYSINLMVGSFWRWGSADRYLGNIPFFSSETYAKKILLSWEGGYEECGAPRTHNTHTRTLPWYCMCFRLPWEPRTKEVNPTSSWCTMSTQEEFFHASIDAWFSIKWQKMSTGHMLSSNSSLILPNFARSGRIFLNVWKKM